LRIVLIHQETMSKNTLSTTDLQVTSYDGYDNHSVVAFFVDPETNIQGFVSFYRMNLKYPAFGATRIWNFPTLHDGLEDSLRLAKTMMYKNAMAGTPYSGAKGVLVSGKLSPQKRKKLLIKYARFVSFLGGRFITGADVGVNIADVKLMKTVSNDYIVGVKVNPVEHTVNGLLSALDSAVFEVFGTKDLSNRTIAVQGVGKTGRLLVDRLHDKVKSIYISDINEKEIHSIPRKYKNVQAVIPEDIHKQKVDIFSPCALGGILNKKTIKSIRAQIILGTANNQLQNDDIATELHRLGIFYAPDYVVNGGGVISVIHEYENKRIFKNILNKRVLLIGKTLKRVIQYSKTHNVSMKKAADVLAERIINKYYDY